jgi:hypothetical protein
VKWAADALIRMLLAEALEISNLLKTLAIFKAFPKTTHRIL